MNLHLDSRHGSRHGAVGLAWLLSAVLLALSAALSAAPRPGRDVDALSEELGRAVLAELQQHEPARENDDPDSLVVVSLGAQGLMAGTATADGRIVDGCIGHVILSGAEPMLTDGVHDLRHAKTGTAVELVDQRGRVVANVPLDPPLDGLGGADEGTAGAEENPKWERVFLTVARALAARLR